jgi:hypothetical protein
MNNDFTSQIMKKDNGFNLNPPSSYQMIISFGKTTLEATVFDPSKKKFIAFLQHNIPEIHNVPGKQAYFDLVKRIFEEEELLKLSYKTTIMIWQSQCSTMVPMPLYDIKERRTYLQFNQVLDASDVDISDNIRSADAINIFTVPAELYSTVGSLHPLIHHHSSVLVESLLILNRHNINPTQVFVNVHNGFFDMVVIHERKLHFYNSFSYSTAEDFIYFVLFAFEQLKLLPERVLVTLSGEIVQHSAIYDILYKYVRNIAFAGPIGQVTESYILQDIPAYQYQTLFNTVLCEL